MTTMTGGAAALRGITRAYRRDAYAITTTARRDRWAYRLAGESTYYAGWRADSTYLPPTPYALLARAPRVWYIKTAAGTRAIASAA